MEHQNHPFFKNQMHLRLDTDIQLNFCKCTNNLKFPLLFFKEYILDTDKVYSNHFPPVLLLNLVNASNWKHFPSKTISFLLQKDISQMGLLRKGCS